MSRIGKAPITVPGGVTVTIVGDLLPEPNETVVLRLGQPSNPAILLGTNPAHTLTIANDDALPAGVPCARLYFSQYAESLVGNTKALEIYNPTNAAVPLAGKRLELFANGRTSMPTALALTGSIPAFGTYVVANTTPTDPGIAAVATGSTGATGSVGFFNGDDALALFEARVSTSLNVRVVDEDILALLTRDEAEALLGVEELHGSSCQLLLFSTGERARLAISTPSL